MHESGKGGARRDGSFEVQGWDRDTSEVISNQRHVEN